MYVLGAEDILTVVKHITSVFNQEKKKEKAPFIKIEIKWSELPFLGRGSVLVLQQHYRYCKRGTWKQLQEILHGGQLVLYFIAT